jgi:brefeldin A-inhibited guanine nucleotide-exchange protein
LALRIGLGLFNSHLVVAFNRPTDRRPRRPLSFDMEADTHAHSIPLAPSSPVDYQTSLRPDDAMTIPTDSNSEPTPSVLPVKSEPLVGIGGGAISVVPSVIYEQDDSERTQSRNVADIDTAPPEEPTYQLEVNEDSGSEAVVDFLPVLPPTPPAKSPAFPSQPATEEAPLQSLPPSSIEQPPHHTNGYHDSQPQTPTTLSPDSPASSSHRRSLTISKGHTVSVVLISSALETIAASKEARRSVPLRDSTQRALEMVRSNQGGDRPREIFEPLRLACETRNEKLMIASLDCISKLISYSFFAESALPSTHSFPSPPPSPNPAGRNSTARASQPNITPPSLVDLVAHTITACHTETTPETVSLQIVKALLSLVLSPTILVHHSSLLKAVRTVYNVFLLSTDPVNQMVAQGGLTQMVHHVFSRCKTGGETRIPVESNTRHSSAGPENNPSSNRASFAMPSPETISHPLSNPHAQGDETDAKPDVPISDSSPSLPSPTGSASASQGPDVTLTERAIGPNQEQPHSRITLYATITLVVEL